MGGEDAKEVSNACVYAYHNNGIEAQRTLGVLVNSIRDKFRRLYRPEAKLRWSFICLSALSTITEALIVNSRK